MLKLDHVGVAVHDLKRAVMSYQKLFKAEITGEGIVENHKNETKVLTIKDNVSFEIMQPTADYGDIHDHLCENGEGLYHLAFIDEDNYDETIAELKVLQKELYDALLGKINKDREIPFTTLEESGFEEDLKLQILSSEGTYKHAMIHPCRYTNFVRIYIYNQKYDFE